MAAGVWVWRGAYVVAPESSSGARANGSHSKRLPPLLDERNVRVGRPMNNYS